MKILDTSVSGFIGSNFLEDFFSKAMKLVYLDKFFTARKCNVAVFIVWLSSISELFYTTKNALTKTHHG